jgi:hypothetical protein
MSKLHHPTIEPKIKSITQFGIYPMLPSIGSLRFLIKFHKNLKTYQNNPAQATNNQNSPPKKRNDHLSAVPCESYVTMPQITCLHQEQFKTSMPTGLQVILLYNSGTSATNLWLSPNEPFAGRAGIP